MVYNNVCGDIRVDPETYTVTVDGEVITCEPFDELALENLKDGDIIYLDDKLCVAVKLTSCPLIKINVHTMQEMGRLCFEIGNRHLSLKISDDNVLIPHDEPTEKHLKNLGFECENIIGRFDDFIVCKAHGHSHSHSHEHGEHHHHEHSH